MELSKDDIEYIAYHRFNKKHQKYFYGIVFGGLALLVIATLLIQKYNPESWQLVLAVAISIALLIVVGLFLYNKAAYKAVKRLVEEFEANPIVTYIKELPKDAKRALN